MSKASNRMGRFFIYTWVACCVCLATTSSSLAQSLGPAPVAKPAAEVVDPRGDDTRPDLGVIFKDGELVVSSVFTNGPFHQVKIYTGDKITEIDGVAVSNVNDITRILMSKNPGELVRITRERNRQSKELAVTLMSRAELYKASRSEGGFSTNISRQYVYHQSPWQKKAGGHLGINQRAKVLETADMRDNRIL